MKRRDFLKTGVLTAATPLASQKPEPDDRDRVKLVRIPSREIVNMMNGRFFETFIWPKSIEGVPEGFYVQAVNFDFCLNCFVCRVQHPSFDAVPIGVIPPYVNDNDLAIEHVIWQSRKFSETHHIHGSA